MIDKMGSVPSPILAKNEFKLEPLLTMKLVILHNFLSASRIRYCLEPYSTVHIAQVHMIHGIANHQPYLAKKQFSESIKQLWKGQDLLNFFPTSSTFNPSLSIGTPLLLSVFSYWTTILAFFRLAGCVRRANAWVIACLDLIKIPSQPRNQLQCISE